MCSTGGTTCRSTFSAIKAAQTISLIQRMSQVETSRAHRRIHNGVLWQQKKLRVLVTSRKSRDTLGNRAFIFSKVRCALIGLDRLRGVKRAGVPLPSDQ